MVSDDGCECTVGEGLAGIDSARVPCGGIARRSESADRDAFADAVLDVVLEPMGVSVPMKYKGMVTPDIPP
jgi:hypothetical protein